MIPRVIRLWLPSALLLSQVPGCVPLHGPSTMTGSVGESLSVSCQYEEKFKTKDKYWCRVSLKVLCKDIVKTSSSEEARNGRVTISDHPDNLTFTVTFENLTLEDADTYMCGVDIPFLDARLGVDKYFKIELSVVPSEDPGPTLETPVVSTSLSTKGPLQGSITEGRHEHHDPQGLRSLLSSPHFWVLVSLELPLFLSMLGAVLWVNRPQRWSGRSSPRPCYENQ